MATRHVSRLLGRRPFYPTPDRDMSAPLMLRLFSPKLRRRPWRLDEFALLLALAYHTNDARGYAWPSLPTLAKEIGTTPRNVARIVHKLERLGLVQVSRGRGRGHVNRYVISIADLIGDGDDSISARGNSDVEVMFLPSPNVTGALEKVSLTVRKGDGSDIENLTDQAPNLKTELLRTEKGTPALCVQQNDEKKADARRHQDFLTVRDAAVAALDGCRTKSELEEVVRPQFTGAVEPDVFDSAVSFVWSGHAVGAIQRPRDESACPDEAATSQPSCGDAKTP